jgi:hypothetical protein
MYPIVEKKNPIFSIMVQMCSGSINVRISKFAHFANHEMYLMTCLVNFSPSLFVSGMYSTLALDCVCIYDNWAWAEGEKNH